MNKGHPLNRGKGRKRGGLRVEKGGGVKGGKKGEGLKGGKRGMLKSRKEGRGRV